MTANSSLPFYTFDISRLLSRSSASAPTGIDRVELEYARYLCQHAEDRLQFSAVHPFGRLSILPFEIAKSFIEKIGVFWDNGEQGKAVQKLSTRLMRSLILPKFKQNTDHTRPDVYLLMSHHHLTRPSIFETIKRRNNSFFVPMVHDLIPLQYPEYSREKEPSRHKRRIETVVKFSDGVLTPSLAVRDALLPYFQHSPRPEVPIWPAPLGVSPRTTAASYSLQVTTEKPYFVCLGTIEGRKNHLLLLNVWRRLIEIHGAKTPRLLIIGKRGWENEQVIDMIERTPSFAGIVREYNNLPNDEVVALLKNARALLFPSFSEGFGLPLAEALALNVPVICSDIPVFQEVGKNKVTYLDPIDGLGWLDTISTYSSLKTPQTPPPYFEDNDALNWDTSVKNGLLEIENFISQKKLA
ncbi:glycosyltransferase family 1 protein [Neokomagataea tanensis]|uniref:Glycosyltransferase family 1 protein n=1 Tax=Neokomagataea tanensis TaxID=661191 RepID=A0A4Y6V7U7_9PROT|nr:MULTISPECIES: glycosyltransferase family 1 protein [Neokomagataea]QDH24626.1 glycosyltransferase family 1 protein [Neokomagataea tanensis]